MERKERPKKEADHSTLGGGSLNEQGKLHIMFVLCGHKTWRSMHRPTRILKVYVEVQSHMPSRQSEQHIVPSRLYFSKWLSLWGGGQDVRFKDRGGGVRSLRLPVVTSF